MRYGDIQCDGGVVMCLLPRSITDQAGRGMTVVLHELRGSPMCPVATFLDYGKLWGTRSGPLLLHEDATFLSPFEFMQVFRNCLVCLGRDGTVYSSHSFRIGVATEAAQWGLALELVKKIGQWEFSQYKLYVRLHLL